MSNINQTERNLLAFAFNLLRQHYQLGTDDGVMSMAELAMTLVTVDELERKVTPLSFWDAFEGELTKIVKASPGHYALAPKQTAEAYAKCVRARMGRAGVAAYNYNSPTFKAVAKYFGIKPTQRELIACEAANGGKDAPVEVCGAEIGRERVIGKPDRVICCQLPQGHDGAHHR